MFLFHIFLIKSTQSIPQLEVLTEHCLLSVTIFYDFFSPQSKQGYPWKDKPFCFHLKFTSQVPRGLDRHLSAWSAARLRNLSHFQAGSMPRLHADLPGSQNVELSKHMRQKVMSASQRGRSVFL